MLSFLMVFLAAFFGACAYADPAEMKRPVVPVFAGFNPPSEAKIKLGRALFFDSRLSGGNSQSCASCHQPDYAWSDRQARSVGENGSKRPRRTPSLFDVGWNRFFAWHGRVESLEGFVLGPITHPDEMNQNPDSLPAELSAQSDYRAMFATAFGDETINLDRISLSIGVFLRSLRSGKSPFDRWLQGDETAISVHAKMGYTLFNGDAGCSQCHSGWRFTDDGFHDTGLAGDDPGRGGLEGADRSLIRAFKTPALRNVALRPPYMHDGSIPSLRAVIRHYDSGFIERPTLDRGMRKLDLTEKQILNLVAFLESLTEDHPAPGMEMTGN